MTTPTDPVQMALEHFMLLVKRGISCGFVGPTESMNYKEDYDTILTALRARTEWRPMETAPTDGTRIMFFDGVQIKVGQWRDTSRTEEKLISRDGNKKTYETVTVKDGYWEIDEFETCPEYWQPLPPPPTDAGV